MPVAGELFLPFLPGPPEFVTEDEYERRARGVDKGGPANIGIAQARGKGGSMGVLSLSEGISLTTGGKLSCVHFGVAVKGLSCVVISGDIRIHARGLVCRFGLHLVRAVGF